MSIEKVKSFLQVIADIENQDENLYDVVYNDHSEMIDNLSHFIESYEKIEMVLEDIELFKDPKLK